MRCAIPRKPRELADEIYLTTLSRFPTDNELAVMKDYALSGDKDKQPMVDLVWALINTAEFLYRH